MKAEPSNYHAYMLRLWQTKLDGQVVWRASLESPHTGERQGFTDLQSLFAYLTDTIELTTLDNDCNSQSFA